MGNSQSRTRARGRGCRAPAYSSDVKTATHPTPTTVSKKLRLPIPESVAHGPCMTCGQLPESLAPSPASSASTPPSYSSEDPLARPPGGAVLDSADAMIDSLDADLRELSLFMWETPELAFQERQAHDRLTAFMESRGFDVTRNYGGLATAWRAEFMYGEGGRTVGLQAEMDALPRIGHACGHNLIAISGVGAALGLRSALLRHGIAGRVVLLGTPAEEHGGGKIELLRAGAYDGMDVCLMAHPGPGPADTAIVAPWTAVQNVEVEYTGHSAHAAYAPWEAQNALDAAFMAYSGISVLRQQMKPTHRVHGIIGGNNDWEPNVIPDYSLMKWGIRAPTWSELEVLRDRVVKCLEAAATATSCTARITLGVGYKDCVENTTLAEEYTRIAQARYAHKTITTSEVLQASTDAGNVSYEIPTIEPVFTIPTEPNGSNHTPAFARSAKSPAAHAAVLVAAKCLAATGVRVLVDDAFFAKVRESFEAQVHGRKGK